MTCTGTLIESLMATVERAELSWEQSPEQSPELSSRLSSGLSLEQRAEADGPLFAAHAVLEPWLAAAPDNADYDSNFMGVA